MRGPCSPNWRSSIEEWRAVDIGCWPQHSLTVPLVGLEEGSLLKWWERLAATLGLDASLAYRRAVGRSRARAEREGRGIDEAT